MKPDNPESPLLIKRYSSRRLYNTENSQYVSLQDVAEIIRSGRDIRIVDRATGEDLTRQYLVQLILEQESNGVQVLPLPILTELVRSYSQSSAIPDYVGSYYQAVREGQERLVNHLMELSLPMTGLREFQEYQNRYFRKMTDGWLPPERVRRPEARSMDGQEEDRNRTSASDELESIKRKLAELEARISGN